MGNRTFQWLFPSNYNRVMRDSSISISTNSSASQLVFDPLQASHEGTITCQVTVENILWMKSYSVIVNGERLAIVNSPIQYYTLPLYVYCTTAPTILVSISESGTLAIGRHFTLICSISGLNNLANLSILYQWSKKNGTLMQAGTNSSIFTFSSLRLSDAGQYTCQVIINSIHLFKDIVSNKSYYLNLESEFWIHKVINCSNCMALYVYSSNSS